MEMCVFLSLSSPSLYLFIYMFVYLFIYAFFIIYLCHLFLYLPLTLLCCNKVCYLKEARIQGSLSRAYDN